MRDIEPFFSAVDTLVRINEDMRLERSDNRHMMHPCLWAREMATVQVAVARQVGKTSYIKERATCADLVIVHNDIMKKEFTKSRATIVSTRDLSRWQDTMSRGMTTHGFNRVYVDEPAMVFNIVDIDRFYDTMCGQINSSLCANMFIMLGTALR